MAALLGVVGAHMALALLWLARDEGLPDGDVLGVLGAVELFWGQTHAEGAGAALLAAWREDFGEYPALHYAVTGILAAWSGVSDLDGDGVPRVGLLWGALALLATGWMARSRGGAAWFGAALLAVSPLWAATQRALLVENAATALVACAAAGWATGGVGWVVGGLFGAAALLTKQTAALALLPALAVLGHKEWRGALGAAALMGVVAGPWYLRRLGSEGDYLLAAAGANPDAAGPLAWLALYPLALVQQAWTPLVVAGAAYLLWRRPRGERALLVAAALGVVLLVLIPKKYPRLLLPLLPLLAAGVAAEAARWELRWRAGLVALGAAGFLLGSTLRSPPPLLGPSSLGLSGLDERCTQRWIGPPSRPGLPWEALLTELDGATSVGAVRWPAPPCAYQTTLHLGEHLRIRARRADLELEVREAFVDTDGWERPPDRLITDGPLPCGEPPEAAGSGDPCAAGWTEQARLPLHHPAWDLDLRVWRR